MAQLVTVAKTTELAPGQAKVVQVKGHTIALFNLAGAYYAIDDACTHEGGPLSEGEVVDAVVTCPWHGAQFDVRSGEVLSPPAPGSVQCYKVHVQGDEVKVEVT